MTKDEVELIGNVLQQALATHRREVEAAQAEARQTIEALQHEVAELRRVVITAEAPPAWRPGSVHRAGAIVEHHIGQRFVAQQDTATEPGTDSAHWQRIGTGGLRLAEPWAEGRVYERGDLFVRDYGTFIQSADEAVLLAGRGAKGEPGPRGQDGKHGADVVGLALRGSRLVLSLRNADGTARTLEADLVPALEALAELMREQQQQQQDQAPANHHNGAAPGLRNMA